jgi:hypothetical protein
MLHGRALISLPQERGHVMEFLIFLIVAAAVVAGVFWAKKHFRNEIDRAKRINRANKNK